MLRSCIFGTALIALLGVACERKPADETAYRTPAATGEEVTAADREFMQNVAKGNEYEVEMAKMAQDKTQNSALKTLAAMLEDDHSSVLANLRGIASRVNVNLDTTPPAEKASMQDKINSMSGKAFDRAWLDEMIAAHRKSASTLESKQNMATGELKEFIDKTLPVVRDHLQKLETASRELGS